VPADVRILTAVAFSVEEAILTGPHSPPSFRPFLPPSRPSSLLLIFPLFLMLFTGESVAVSKVAGPMNAR